ncbi:hypothetical protein BU16DRAFT_316267 [Lophium mytilinum]|uniref:Uncharacterized protein n=1 Tax=Lophium mytilinum TaxID=390894 RepID=A0A6A6R104_9PEZI|nr:hypothetical protein BU16DRAFT_316267 [Lophium mytilinum]
MPTASAKAPSSTHSSAKAPSSTHSSAKAPSSTHSSAKAPSSTHSSTKVPSSTSSSVKAPSSTSPSAKSPSSTSPSAKAPSSTSPSAKAPSTTPTSTTQAGPVAIFSSLLFSGSAVVASLCTCIEKPLTTTVTSVPIISNLVTATGISSVTSTSTANAIGDNRFLFLFIPVRAKQWLVLQLRIGHGLHLLRICLYRRRSLRRR